MHDTCHRGAPLANLAPTDDVASVVAGAHARGLKVVIIDPAGNISNRAAGRRTLMPPFMTFSAECANTQEAPMSAHRDEIENLLARYCELYDVGDFVGYAALFQHGSIAGPTGAFTSPEEIVAYHRENCILYDGSPQTMHVTTNVNIEVADGARTASARSYVTVYQAAPGFPLQTIFVGQYLDELHQVDGRWWFLQRRAVARLVGDLSHHAHHFVPATH